MHTVAAPVGLPSSRRPAVLLALVVSVTHFTAAFVALRALMATTAQGSSGPVALHALVALLAFPLFYTRVPALFGGHPHTGVYLAVLNALLWGAVAWALMRWLTRRRR